MTASRSRTFRSGNSEAVRLPREVAFGREVDVTIVRSGDVLTIFPTRPSMVDMMRTLDSLPKPTEIEIRDEEEIPEPEGL